MISSTWKTFVATELRQILNLELKIETIHCSFDQLKCNGLCAAVYHLLTIDVLFEWIRAFKA